MNKAKNASNVDPMFTCVAKTKSSFNIWRVEENQLISVGKDFYGIFFKADVYLIFSCSETVTKSISQHIHLWIGSESSNDDQSFGAFKMIELDEYLNNSPIQHRECQNYETERFLSYFKSQGGIKYMNGGWLNGDHYYEKEFHIRLYRVKGKRLVRLNELKCLDWSSLNRNDSFLIDFNTVLFLWNGRNTKKTNKLKLLQNLKLLRNEKSFNVVVTEDGEEKDLNKDELRLFELYFPLKDKIKKLKNEPSSDLDDIKLERDINSCLKLYKCSYGQEDEDDTIKIKIIEQKLTPIYREDLLSEDTFIIDNGKLGIYVWSGKKCSPKERQEAMRNALGFLQAKGYDEQLQNAIKVTCVNENYEPVEFRSLFSRWSESKYSVNSNNKSLQVKFDAHVLNLNNQLAAELQMVDDGTGSKKIWNIDNNLIISLLDDSKHGQFYSSNCYVIQYKYTVNGADKYIIFYWIGRNSSKEMQTAALMKASEQEIKLIDCHLVRIFQEKETKQFMSIFDGRIIIFQDIKNEIASLENYMLQVKYYSHFNIKAIQVEFSPSSLNSNNVFIVCSNSVYFVWCGKASTGDERETAKSLITGFKKDPEIVIESQEKENFWKALGGKQAYYTDKRPPVLSQSAQIARLFEVLNENGKSSFQEIFEFSQEDLNTNEIMILDVWEALFVCIGSASTKKDMDDFDKIIKEYLRNDPCQRQIDTPIFKIRQGFEPIYFTGFFNSEWNENILETGLTYNQLKQELQSKNQLNLFEIAFQSLKPNEAKKNTLFDFSNYPKYSYDELIKPADELPENVNTTIREVYLKESDFQKIFNMTFEEFSQKPAWKQKELKRSAHLF